MVAVTVSQILSFKCLCILHKLFRNLIVHIDLRICFHNFVDHDGDAHFWHTYYGGSFYWSRNCWGWCRKCKLCPDSSNRHTMVSEFMPLILFRIVSPLTSALLTTIFITLACKHILNETTHSFGARLQSLSFLAGLSLAFIVLLVFSLIYDDMFILLSSYNWLYLVGVFWFGFGTARYVVIHHRTDGKHKQSENLMHCYLTPWKE